MKNRINNILIGLLWLLAATLGLSFWFNTQYGFNIFSAQHWQYLAYMQASHQPVKLSFYISLVLAVIITIFVLYKLLQPHRRKIALPIIDKSARPKHLQPTPQPIQVSMDNKTQEPTPKTNANNESTSNTYTNGLVRPPRLNIPTATRTQQPTPRVPLSSTTTQQKINPEQEYADIHEIFKSAGFIYKGAPRIKNVQTSIIAIGANEILWIGATNVSTPDMQRAVDTLRGVFADTLDDIEIDVHAFIIAAPDAATNTNGDILQFANVDDLRSYINEHPNTPPDDDELENLDAYSGYIGTVVEYIGKI